MKIIKPAYYDKFKCIADKCPYTCCQEWDIGVDNKTVDKWKCMNYSGDEDSKLVNGIVVDNEGARLKFNEHGKCPNLNENGLCKIVIAYGDENIPKACQTFPREKHIYGNRKEFFLSPGCPAVIDLLWKSEEFFINESQDNYGDLHVENEDYVMPNPIWKNEEVYFKIREWFFEIVNIKEKPVNILLKTIFFIGMDLNEKDINGILDDAYLAEYKKNVDIYEIVDAIESLNIDPVEQFAERNELLLDILEVYREKGKYPDFIDPIVKQAEYISENDYSSVDRSVDCIVTSGEYAEKLRKLVCEEILSSLISQDLGGMQGMMVKLEWLIMEYIAIVQSAHLLCAMGNKITYDNIRYIVTVIFRIMGFADEDICEVIEDEFDSLVWPWEYVGFTL